MSPRKPNMESSIYLGNDGWWHGRVTMGIKSDGTPDRRHRRAKTEHESRLAAAGAQDLGAEWVAFGFVAPAGSEPDAGVSVDQVSAVAVGVLDQEIAGYYDEFEHRLHLPAPPPAPTGAARRSAVPVRSARRLRLNWRTKALLAP